MNPLPVKDAVIRFSWPIKISLLLVALTSLFSHVPRAIQAIPAEALGPMFFYLAVPALLAYAAFVVFSFRVQIKADRIAVDVLPNPIWRSFECAFADISGIEQEIWWSTLCLYRFKEAEPCRITHLALLEGSPAELLGEITNRTSRDPFVERATETLRRGWKSHRQLTGGLVLSIAAWTVVLFLDPGAALALSPEIRRDALALLPMVAAALGAMDLLALRYINRGP